MHIDCIYENMKASGRHKTKKKWQKKSMKPKRWEKERNKNQQKMNFNQTKASIRIAAKLHEQISPVTQNVFRIIQN